MADQTNPTPPASNNGNEAKSGWTQGSPFGETAQGTPSPQETAAGGPNGPEQAAPGTTAAAGTTAAVAAAPWYARAPLWLSILLLLALLACLGWLIYQKYLAEQKALAEQEQALAQLKADNDAREAYLQQLRALLEKDPCDIVPGLSSVRPPQGHALPVLPDAGAQSQGRSGEPLQIPPRDTPQNRDPGTPAPAPAFGEKSTTPAPSQSLPQAQTPTSTAQLMEQGTVLILADQGQGLSMGSGFFIAPDTIMTNAHVVGQAKEVIFINKFVGSARSAVVLMRTQAQGLDFAVLRTRETMPVTPLRIATTMVSRTEKVSAWGFPGAVTSDDPKFRRLLMGNAEAAPEVVFTEGVVNVVLERKPPLVVHSATVSQGNSGGPLVNAQGDVVGINTMIKLDDKSYRQSSLAIPSTILAEFLKANKVPFTASQAARKAGGAQ